MHDVNVLDYLNFIAGAYYIIDRGYLDFQRLYKLNQSKAFFVTRAKRNTKLTRRTSRPIDKSTGVQCDQVVVLEWQESYELYPNSFTVKSQMWIGVRVYVLIAILKKKLKLSQTLYQILQILSLTQVEKMPILSLFEHETCKSTNMHLIDHWFYSTYKWTLARRAL